MAPKHSQHPIVPIQQYNKQNESIQSQNSQLRQHPSAIQYTQQQKYPQPEANNHHHQNNTHPLNYHSQAVYTQQQQQQQPLQQQQTNLGKSIMANHKQTTQHQQQQQQQLQQKYYDQYENYARPTAQPPQNYNNNSINNVVNNNNHANVPLAYNNAAAHHAGQGYSSNSMAGHVGNAVQYNTAINNHVYSGGDYSAQLNLNAASQIGAGIGKISDYDPITDGPRNIPNTTRPSSTLIYSSDRGMSKLFKIPFYDCNLYGFFFFFHFLIY